MEVSTPRPDPPKRLDAEAPRMMTIPIQPEADEAATISLFLQPMPTLTRVVHFKIWRWTVTAIMRHWRSGESGPSGPCRLCPSCTAYQDGCLKVVAGLVSKQDAALFDTTGATRQPPLMGGHPSYR
jgi:hypothetical protein